MNLNLLRSSPSSLYKSRSRIEFSAPVRFLPPSSSNQWRSCRISCQKMSCKSPAPPVLQTVTVTISYPELIVRILTALFGCRENGGKGLEMKFRDFDFSDVWFPGEWSTRRESVNVLCDTQLSCSFFIGNWTNENCVIWILFPSLFSFSDSQQANRDNFYLFRRDPTKRNGKEIHFLTSSNVWFLRN